MGRDKSHVLFMEGKSISRNHVQLVIDTNPAKCEVVSVKKPRIDTGVYVNGKKLASEERLTLKKDTAYRVQVGRKEDSFFTLKWRPVSFLYHENEEEVLLQAIIRGSDLTMERHFSNETTHYVKGKKNSSKLLLAMVRGVSIVGRPFLDELLRRKQQNLAVVWPDETEYVPEPEFGIEKSRSQIWAGMTFAFSDKQQLEMLGPVITEGGGRTLCLSLEDDTSTSRTVVDTIRAVDDKAVLVRPHERKYQQVLVDAMLELSKTGGLLIDAADLLPAIKECNPGILRRRAAAALPRGTAAAPKLERLETVLTPVDDEEDVKTAIKPTAKPPARPVKRLKRVPPKQMDLLDFFVKEEDESASKQPEGPADNQNQPSQPDSLPESQRRPLRTRARVEPINHVLFEPSKKRKVDVEDGSAQSTTSTTEEPEAEEAPVDIEMSDDAVNAQDEPAVASKQAKTVDFSSAVQHIKSEHARVEEDEHDSDIALKAHLSIDVKEGTIAVRRPPPLQATRLKSVVNASKYEGRRNFKKFDKKVPAYLRQDNETTFSRFDRSFVALVPDSSKEPGHTSIEDMLTAGENLTDRRIRIMAERGAPSTKYRALDVDMEELEEEGEDDLFLRDTESASLADLPVQTAVPITIDDDSDDETKFRFSK